MVTPTDNDGPMPEWLEDAWLGRYLDRLLTEEETHWFEQYVLDKHRLLSLIDADTRLRKALREGDDGADKSPPVHGNDADDQAR
jgi:hypothetical protein